MAMATANRARKRFSNVACLPDYRTAYVIVITIPWPPQLNFFGEYEHSRQSCLTCSPGWMRRILDATAPFFRLLTALHTFDTVSAFGQKGDKQLAKFKEKPTATRIVI